jgi:hypothetical protein
MIKRKGNIAVKIAKVFVYFCRFPFVSVPIIGDSSGFFLYYFNGTDIAKFFIVTIIAWIASDFLTPFIIRGGSGIFQFKLHGTHTIPEGYGFLTFFGVILALTIVINVLCDNTTKALSAYLSNPWVALMVGLVLSTLVFVDLWVKFYKHEKQRT